MPQAQDVVSLIKAVSEGDVGRYNTTVTRMIANEKAKKHWTVAERLERASKSHANVYKNFQQISPVKMEKPGGNLFREIDPDRPLDSVFLPSKVKKQIQGVVEEHQKIELLQEHGLAPRHRLLFKGPSGNGKTSLAEALAYELQIPFFVLSYESVVGSLLGETASRLKKVMDYVSTQNCVLFFDEFETLVRERGADNTDTGEIKRVTSVFLLQMEQLPPNVVFVGATNHSDMLDRATWRRFQVKVDLPLPTKEQLGTFVAGMSEKFKVDFGNNIERIVATLDGESFAFAEDFCLEVIREAVLAGKVKDPSEIIGTKIRENLEVIE